MRVEPAGSEAVGDRNTRLPWWSSMRTVAPLALWMGGIRLRVGRPVEVVKLVTVKTWF